MVCARAAVEEDHRGHFAHGVGACAQGRAFCVEEEVDGVYLNFHAVVVDKSPVILASGNDNQAKCLVLLSLRITYRV